MGHSEVGRSTSGSITVYAVLGPGELFGELAYLAGVSRQVDAVADEDTVLVRISTLLVDGLLETEPMFARWLLKSLVNQLRLALDRIEGDNHLPAQARMIRVLADLTQRNGLEIAITQQALGELIGVSRVTAGHILHELEALQLLRLEYRRIIVIDPERLAATSQY